MNETLPLLLFLDYYQLPTLFIILQGSYIRNFYMLSRRKIIYGRI